ncbi:MAG: hypothetical protein ACLR6J_05775 [Parabacteroides merdae]
MGKTDSYLSIVDVGNQMLHLLKTFSADPDKGKAVPSKIIKHMTAVNTIPSKAERRIKRDSPTSNPIFRKRRYRFIGPTYPISGTRQNG